LRIITERPRNLYIDQLEQDETKILLIRAVMWNKNVMNFINIGIKTTVLIRQIDLSDLKSSYQNKIKGKMQKTENPIFSLYFCGNSFLKMLCLFRST